MSQAEHAELVGRLMRQRRVSERALLWILLGTLIFLGLAVLTWFIASGRLSHLHPDIFAANLRGYTALGELMGVLSALFVALTFGFSLRKRFLQERWMLGKGTMMAWLWVHVVAGSLALIAAVLHAGFGLLDYRVTSGKLLFWTLLFVSASGAVWRLIYHLVPKIAAPKVGNYAQETNLTRAQLQQMEIEKRSAGGSPVLHEMKAWLLGAPRSDADIAAARQRIPPQELATFDAIVRLSASRFRALSRSTLQQRYVRWLQSWRVLHVPLSILLLALLGVHLIGVYDVIPSLLQQNPKWMSADARAFPALTGEHSSENCKACHAAIYEEWRHSMHAHALSSPVMIVQTNQVYERELKTKTRPDPQFICVSCHAPSEIRLAPSARLPLEGTQLNEGIGCTVCHQFAGDPKSGSGAFVVGAATQLAPGSTMLGPIEGAVGNTYHRSRKRGPFAADSSTLCQTCHDVHLDRNGDDRIEFATDLVLQSTYQEYAAYREAGGAATCVACHMPQVARRRAASSARVPIEQDFPAEDRVVHSHAFVGVDYPLNLAPTEHPHRDERHALLQRAATLKLAGVKRRAESLQFQVEVSNVGAGHDLPSGFAFARQMWLEVIVTADDQSRLFESGVLAKPTDDLCDAATLAPDNGPIRQHVQGCTEADPQLVNLQRRLVDATEVQRNASGQVVRDERGRQVAAAKQNSNEVSIQRVAGGPVVRIRPSDRQPLRSIPVGQTHRYAYEIPLKNGAKPASVSVRLLFRHLPPYFLRDLAANQPEGEPPDLLPWINNLEVVEMATTTQDLKP